MTSVIKHHARAFMLSVATAALLTPTLQADCTYELFNISSVKGTSVGEFVDQLSDECGMSVVVTDEQAEEVLKRPMNKTFLKNLTINEVFDLIIKENNLQYTLQNNLLKISYLTTKTYNIDYITTERKGTGSTNIRLSSNSGTAAGASGSAEASGGNNASAESGTNISTIDEVKFWDTLEQEVKSILSRPEDDYRQSNTL
ncbi:secretin N-terminal domain-containing protein, partial [Sulfuricurvum sp. RIFOXYD2_FULL_44_160]